jgi:response regulator RpfG family c-di-GMP phosphodiesterase
VSPRLDSPDEARVLVVDDDEPAALSEAVERREASERELSRSREETIQRLSLAIEVRSHETGARVERIGVGAERVSRRLGLGEQRCEMLRLAAVLHDDHGCGRRLRRSDQ